MNEIEFYKIVGTKIDNERIKQKLSNTKFAKMVGVSRPNIVHIETNYIRVSLFKLVKIARVLKVPLTSLLP